MSKSTVVFYKIICNDQNKCNDVFVDFTSNIVRKRHSHKTNSNNINKKSTLYTSIRNNGGWREWKCVNIGTETADNAPQLLDEYKKKHNHTLSNVDIPVKWGCEYCGVSFNIKSRLNRHYKSEKHLQICRTIEEERNKMNGKTPEPINQTLDAKTVLDLIEEKLSSKEKNICNTNNNTTTTNNTINNNNKFNLNFFLNNTCKDALTIDQFVEQID